MINFALFRQSLSRGHRATNSQQCVLLLQLRFSFSSQIGKPHLDHPATGSSAPTLLCHQMDQAKARYADKIQRLTQTLNQLGSGRYEKNLKLLEDRRRLVSRLQDKVCGPSVRLVLVGSVANGIATDAAADLDLAFYSTNNRFYHDFAKNAMFKRLTMELVCDALQKAIEAPAEESELKLCRKPELILHSLVPIINARFVNGLSMDIQFSRTIFQSIKNTNLVKLYIAADSRFYELYIWLKRLFNEMGVRNSRMSLFSSYHTLALVLHFLHRPSVPNNVLPVLSSRPEAGKFRELLPEHISDVIASIEGPPLRSLPGWQSKCAKGTGELALELVDYWARFDPARAAVNLETGSIVPIKGTPLDRLAIFEQFSRHSITRSKQHLELLKTSFKFLQIRLLQGKYIDSFPALDGIGQDFLAFCAEHKFPWYKLVESTQQQQQMGGPHQQIADQKMN